MALSAHALVGRSSACSVRLEEARASAEHARIEYREGGWTVRDLGSRNGTFVNGTRLERGGAQPLSVNDKLVFGDHGVTWVLLDLSPPVALARHLRTGAILPATSGLLALPSSEEPTVCVVEAEDGQWAVESDGTARLAMDGEVLTAKDEAFVLHLPTALPITVQEDVSDSSMEPYEIGIRVSTDEEAVEVSLRRKEGLQVLSPRSHHYTLLTLARLRLRDSKAGDLAESQRGWVSVDELCRMLHMDEVKLNVEIYRIRREMAAVGLSSAAQVVERRRGSRQLRLGTERLHIKTFS